MYISVIASCAAHSLQLKATSMAFICAPRPTSGIISQRRRQERMLSSKMAHKSEHAFYHRVNSEYRRTLAPRTFAQHSCLFILFGARVCAHVCKLFTNGQYVQTKHYSETPCCTRPCCHTHIGQSREEGAISKQGISSCA